MENLENRSLKPKLVPGPKGHFFLGSLPERRKNPLALYMDASLQYGEVIRFKMGLIDVYLMNDSDAVKHVLQDNSKNYIKGFGYDKLEPVLGRGLLTNEGPSWHQNRKLAQPAFHRQKISAFSKIMVDSTQEMLGRWKQNGENFQLDLAREMMRLTLTVVSRALLGVDVSQEADQVGESITRLIAEANRRILSVFNWPDRLPLPSKIQFRNDVATLNNVVYRMIEARRKNRGGPEKGDLLSLLMMAQDEETGVGLTDSQLRDEVMTIFLAGHETTANALAWTFALLSKHPMAERKLREELDLVLGGRAPSAEDYPKLQYTQMVLSESMRLYPPAWVFSRQALEDDEVNGYRIPKGSIVVLCPYVLHRSPKYWDNPEGFDPERFLPEKVKALPKYAYFPFGGGPRVCIGSGFAQMEAVLILATVLQRYRLSLVPGHSLEPEALLTLRPKYGVTMNLRAQLPAFSS